MALIDAVVVNHDSSLYTELLLRSLRAFHPAGLDLALTIVDNASTDDMTSLCQLAGRWDVPVVQSGFDTKTKRNSHGEVLSHFVAAHRDSPFLLFLDCDVCFMQERTIDRLLAVLQQRGELFGVGPRQSWDHQNEIPEESRANVYDRRLFPCCALIRNDPLFRRVVEEFGLHGATFHQASGESYWDTLEVMTRVMRTHERGFAVVPDAMIHHFFNVTYDPRGMEDKNARRDKMLAQFRAREERD